MTEPTALQQLAQSPLMSNHKPQGPAQAYIYHPEQAPKGQLILLADMEKWLSKAGWVDSPAKFPGAQENLAVSQKDQVATTEQIVDQAVKEELRKQASGEVQVVGDDLIPPAGEIQAEAAIESDRIKDSVKATQEKLDELSKPKTKRKTTKRKAKSE